ncbi:MAG: SCO family protein [Steroidobacteraceae bacterium]
MIGNEDFPGRFQLLTFGYTSCPDVCPLTLTRMVQAQRLLGASSAQLQLIFITLDPERDGPEAIARYTAYFDPRIIGLTGSPELVRAAARHYKIRFRKYAEPGAPRRTSYSVDHTAGSLPARPGQRGFIAPRCPRCWRGGTRAAPACGDGAGERARAEDSRMRRCALALALGLLAAAGQASNPTSPPCSAPR